MNLPSVGELIPHEGPAVLLDGVVAHSEEETICAAQVHPEMQYVLEGRADAALALELMAQAVAVHVGLRGRWSGGIPRQGYVVGVPKMKFFGGDYQVGEKLEIRVRVVFVEGPVGRFEGEVLQGANLRAAGSLTVFEPPVSSDEANP